MSLSEWLHILAYKAPLLELLWKGCWTEKNIIAQTFIYWLSADRMQFIQSQANQVLKKHCYEQVLTKCFLISFKLL